MFLPPVVSDVLFTLLKSAAYSLGHKLGEVAGEYIGSKIEGSSISTLLPFPVKEDPRYVEALTKYQQSLTRSNQIKAQELKQQREFSKQLLELLREWQANQIQGKLQEIQAIFDQKNLATIFSREESYNILVEGQKKHRLLVLVAPPNVSPSCPSSLQHDLKIELPEKLKTFLNQDYPLDSDLCPVECFGDYFTRAIGDADVRQLQTILAPVPTIILHSKVTDYEVYFHINFWNPQSSNIAKFSISAWNWEDAKESLQAAGKNETQAIRMIRQIIVTVHQLLAAFVVDWYYLNLNPTYEPQLFRLESAFVSGGLAADLVKPYIISLQEIQQQQRKAYEQELKWLAEQKNKLSLNPEKLKCVYTLTGHLDWVSCVVFSPDREILASSSNDKTIRLWNVKTGKLIRTLNGHSHTVKSIAISPDKQTIASGGYGSYDRNIQIWNLKTGQNNTTLTGHLYSVNCVALSPDGQTLASGSNNNTIKLWDLQSGNCIRTLTEHSGGVLSIAFSPDGQKLASGSYDKTVKIWNCKTGRETYTFSEHADEVYSVAYSPDGQMLASCSGDKTINLWYLATGKKISTCTGHSNDIYSVAFSPDGQTLASGGGDKTVKLWNLNGQEIRTLTGHSGYVKSVAFSPDGQTLASGGGDKTIKIWRCE